MAWVVNALKKIENKCTTLALRYRCKRSADKTPNWAHIVAYGYLIYRQVHTVECAELLIIRYVLAGNPADGPTIFSRGIMIFG